MKRTHMFLFCLYIINCIPSTSWAFIGLRNTILLGSIQFNQPVEQVLTFPLLYNGNSYQFRTEMMGDTRNAYVELYEDELKEELYILITERIMIPKKEDFTHLQTAQYPYRLFRLKRTMSYGIDKKVIFSWHIEEINNSEQYRIIPDNTIIVFMPTGIFDKLETMSWQFSNIVQLPKIHVKENIDKQQLVAIADRMKLASVDFAVLHRKPQSSLVLCESHLLSLPLKAHTRL